VTKNLVEIHLLPKEFILLELLMRNCNQVLSVDALIDQVWGEGHDVTPDTVRSYIKTLRKKLCDASIIHTVHGVGYKIVADGNRTETK
jgi:DNA-binding response OmpR family regulator